jgi:hypothetical protein
MVAACALEKAMVAACALGKAMVAAWAAESASYAAVFLSHPHRPSLFRRPRRPPLYAYRSRLTHQTGPPQSAMAPASGFEQSGQS